MTREEAHKLIDQLFDAQQPEVTSIQPETSDKPKDKRVVRTKSTGDRVYLIDEKDKTKAWITSGDILEKLGFNFGDVQEVDDKDMLGYKMTASIYKVD